MVNFKLGEEIRKDGIFSMSQENTLHYVKMAITLKIIYVGAGSK